MATLDSLVHGCNLTRDYLSFRILPTQKFCDVSIQQSLDHLTGKILIITILGARYTSHEVLLGGGGGGLTIEWLVINFSF